MATKSTKKPTEKTDKEWAALAKKQKVKTPFFCVAGHPVRRTSDGKPYFSPDQLWEDAKAHYENPDLMWKDITGIHETGKKRFSLVTK